MRDELGRLTWLAVGMLVALAAGAAGPFDCPFAAADLDVAACQTFTRGKAKPATEAELLTTLGLAAAGAAWSAGYPPRHPDLLEGTLADTFSYRLAFRRPVTVGAMFGPGGAYYVLKDEAAYPGDPAQPAQWQALETRPRQAGGVLITLPPKQTVRALLYTHELSYSHYSFPASRIEAWRFFGARLHNAVPEGFAWASHETSGGRARNLVAGTGGWVSSAVDRYGEIRRPPISDVFPEILVVFWNQPQMLTGLCISDNFAAFEVSRFVGPDALSPPTGDKRDWEKLAYAAEWRAGWRWLSFAPTATRGLRFKVTQTGEKQERTAQVGGLQVFADLQEAPVPPLPAEKDWLAPYRIPYQMPEAGYVTMVLEDLEEREVKNLFARVQREAGAQAAPWDLKDEYGHYVPPGRYRWRAISHPPLHYRYEFSVLPNVEVNSPGSTPWRSSHGGPGGWLADHGPSVGAATLGDQAFFGGVAPENGTGFIATDLEGRRLWGIPGFGPWTGAYVMATTGKYVFVAGPPLDGNGIPVASGSDSIWKVDTEAHGFTTYLVRPGTNVRAGGIRGLAAYQDKLYVAINAGVDWLANAASAQDVDIVNCRPQYAPPRVPKWQDDRVPDPRTDFLRLFRLASTPPGWRADGALITLCTAREPRAIQHIVLAFARPIAIGSVVYPVPQGGKLFVKLSVLKPDAPYPPDPDNQALWTPFANHGKLAWDVVPAPEKTVTRALRVSLSQQEIDELAELPVAGNGKEPTGAMEAEDDLGLGGAAWYGQLDGMRILRRRYVNLFGTAKLRVSSGFVTKAGAWYAQPQRPLSSEHPEVCVLEWPEPQALRGLAIEELEARRTEIDVWTGAPGADIPLTGDQGWERVASYAQTLRGCQARGILYYDGEAKYMDGYVDFGREVTTRAVRLRLVEEYTTIPTYYCGYYRDPARLRAETAGQKFDAAQPFNRLYGIAPLQYVGGEDPIDPRQHERLEVLAAEAKAPATMGGANGAQVVLQTPKVEQEIHVPALGKLATHPTTGELLALSGRTVVKVDVAAGKYAPLISDLQAPRTLVVDAQGSIYVYDDAPARRQIRVYNAAGIFQRSIGTAGGHRMGPWDPSCLNQVCDLAIDRLQHLWVVEFTMWPKRISRWTLDGKFEKEFFGHTPYGGGGALDAWDKRRLFFGPMEFELDWDKGLSRLKNLTWLGDTPPGDLPIRVNGKTYLVTREASGSVGTNPCGVVYLHQGDRAKRVAALGAASGFAPLSSPELMEQLRLDELGKFQFIWADENDDGLVQAGEVKVAPYTCGRLMSFNRDLSVVGADGVLFEVEKFLPNGAPVYHVARKLSLPGGLAYRLDSGNYLSIGSGRGGLGEVDQVTTPDGKLVWAYPILMGCGVKRWFVPPWEPQHVMMEFFGVGHETTRQGDLGEFVVTNSNEGTWHIWTADGLLAGRIFESFRNYRSRPWSMPQAVRGMSLDGISVGEEHFNATHFVRIVDEDKYYAVAGHNHISIVEVEGMNRFKRFQGEIAVTAADFQRTLAWEEMRQRREVEARVPFFDALRLRPAPVIDGQMGNLEWLTGAAAIETGAFYGQETQTLASFRLGYDEQNLYLGCSTWRLGPLKNSGEDWHRLFKTGAAVDVKLGLDAKAETARRGPVKGDLRLLLTFCGRKPLAVLYEAVAPEADGIERWTTATPAGGTVTFDRVRQLPKVKMAVSDSGDGYTLEAAIPLADLGLTIVNKQQIRLDWGVLCSGPDGTEVVRRLYWANTSDTVTSDEPTEARLQPGLWGTVRFLEQKKDDPNLIRPGGVGDLSGGEGKNEDDLLDELDGK